MDYSVPKYYRQFRCIAASCPDSCCKDWAVDVDAESVQRYRALPGALGEHLRQVLQDTDDSTVMVIQNGRCPMWRPDGLCSIQAELGHDALCTVCRTFPRLRHDYGDFVELGLELSCPEAARLILTCSDFTMDTEFRPGGESGEYDPEDMDILRRSRRALLTFLEDRSWTVPQALTVLLLYAHGVQNELDGGEPAVLAPDQLLTQAASYPRQGTFCQIVDFFRQLEILTPQWQSRLEHIPAPSAWTEPFRALIVYFVQRYWLQAISDLDLICRAKLIVTACLLIHGLGGDVIQTAQLFSKEIENDPDNLEAILDGAYTSPALTDLALLTLLAN